MRKVRWNLGSFNVEKDKNIKTGLPGVKKSALLSKKWQKLQF